MEKTNYPKIIVIAVSIFCSLVLIMFTFAYTHPYSNKNLLIGDVVAQANVYQGKLVLIRDYGDSSKNNFKNQQIIQQINDIL